MVTRENRMAVVVLAAALGAAGAGVACVIADPPAEIPVKPLRTPEISREEVAPPVTQILATWPVEFLVPVKVDATSTFEYQFFVDYNSPSAPHQGLVSSRALDPDPASADAGVRLVDLRLNPPTELGECHTLELLVAFNFQGIHTPASTGSDSVVWFYSPSGSLQHCAVFDGGVSDAGGGEAAAGADAGSD